MISKGLTQMCYSVKETDLNVLIDFKILQCIVINSQFSSVHPMKIAEGQVRQNLVEKLFLDGVGTSEPGLWTKTWLM